MYITVPIPSRPASDTIEPFVISVSEQSCSSQPFTLNVVSTENKWTYLATISMSDDDFACLKRVVLEADRKRRVSKENALEALRNELEPVSDHSGQTTDSEPLSE